MHCQLVNREWRKEGGRGGGIEMHGHIFVCYMISFACVFCMEMGMLLWYSIYYSYVHAALPLYVCLLTL